MLKYVVDRKEDSGARPARPRETGPPPAATGPGPRALPRGGARAVVGGIDYSVGGWGEYEIGRRRERWEASKQKRAVRGGAPAPEDHERPGSRYKGRTYIHADDVVRSVLAGARAAVGGGRAAGGAARRTPLQRAALRLADVLGRLEERLCDADDEGVWECEPPSALGARAPARHFTIPAVTSADLRAFAEDPEQAADPDALADLGDDVLSVAASVGAALPAMPSLAAAGMPPLPSRAVPVSDDEAVLRLESAAAPYVATIEELQASLAGRLDEAASAIEAALAK